MPDKIFFPLILLGALGMIWVATLRAVDSCPSGSVSAANTNYITITIAGTQLNRFIPGQTLDMTSCKADDNYILGLRARTREFPASPDIGPHFRLAPDIEFAFSDRNIKVTVRARATAQEGANAFEANYFTGPEGTSGWHQFVLTDTFTDYTFDYGVPTASRDQGVDFLGIRPIFAEGASGFEIESVTFEKL